MKSIQLVCLCLFAALASAPVRADDAHHGAPAPSAAADGALASKEEANAKPAKRKPKRNKARATVEATPTEKQPAAGAHADTHADAPHDPAVSAAGAVAPAPAAGTAKRVRVKDRAAAAAAVAASQADAAHADTLASDGRAQHDQTRDSPAAASAPATAPATALDAAPPVAEPGVPQRAADECNPPFKSEIAALFERWNAALRSGDPKQVVAQYAPDSILLPTLSNRARFTAAEKEDYFVHFLQRRPEGKVDDRLIDVDCNSATDAGLYTFRFADGSKVQARYSFSYKKIDGQWLITSHHSSAMPEKPVAEEKAVQKAADNGASGKGWVRFP